MTRTEKVGKRRSAECPSSGRVNFASTSDEHNTSQEVEDVLLLLLLTASRRCSASPNARTALLLGQISHRLLAIPSSRASTLR